MDTPNPEPTPPAPEAESRAGLNLITAAAAVMVLVALVLAFKGRDMYHAYVASRSAGIAEKAMKLVEEEHYEEASRLLQDGFRLTPDNMALSRVIAELFFRAYDDPSTAVSFLRKVLSSPEGTSADRLRLAQILLAGGETAEARRFYGSLPPAEQTGRKGLELLAGIKRQAGEIAEADALLRRALTLAPEDPGAQLQLAILDVDEAFDQAKDSMSGKIWELAGRKDAVALDAISHLAQSRTLTAVQARQLKTMVENHPLARDRHRYTVLRTFLRLNPLDQDAVVQAETARTQSRKVEDKFDFLRWLGTVGEYERLIQIIPPDAVLRDADIFLIYVDALTAAERWKEVLALMQSARKPPVTSSTAHLILAQCYAKLRPDLVDARRELASVLNAGGKPELPVLLRAAAIAESLHMYDLAVQGMKIMAQARPAVRIQMLEKIYSLQLGQHNTEGMVEVLKQLNELRPGNATYISRLNYLRLVSGVELEPAYDGVLGASARDVPTEASDVAPALLRALVALRFGDSEALKREVAAISDPDGMPAGQRAVVAGLYHLTGRDVEGFRLAEKVPPSLLIDGEKRFLRRSIR